MISASLNVTFCLPEALRGVSALAGALPRAMLLCGIYRIMDLILTGRRLSVEEALSWGLVKEIVTQEQLLARALTYTVEIAEKRPDSVIISRLGARDVGETSVSRATMRGQELYAEAMLRKSRQRRGTRNISGEEKATAAAFVSMMDKSYNVTYYAYVEYLGSKIHLRDSEYTNALLCHLQSLLAGRGFATRAIPFEL